MDPICDSVQTVSSGIKHHSLQSSGKQSKDKAQVKYPKGLSYRHLLPLPGKVSTTALLKGTTHPLPAAYSSSYPVSICLLLGYVVSSFGPVNTGLHSMVNIIKRVKILTCSEPMPINSNFTQRHVNKILS